jgi:hypothetical protein
MFPARSSALRWSDRAGPGPRETWTGGIVRRGSFFCFSDRRGIRVPPEPEASETSRMMQTPNPHAIDARPAAVRAVPGAWPSCAEDPPASGRGGHGFGFGRIRHSIRRSGQDRRYQKDQRGRAVACA